MDKLIFTLNNYYVKTLDADCSILGPDLNELLQDAFTAIKICIPILVLVLVSIDMLSAVTSGDEKNMKEAQNRTIKRLIIGVVIFFIPTIINLILSWIGMANGTCGIE